jgi:hypothetical protein
MKTVEQATEIFPKAMAAEVPNQNDFTVKKVGKEIYEEMLNLLHSR